MLWIRYYEQRATAGFKGTGSLKQVIWTLAKSSISGVNARLIRGSVGSRS
jgi:hypothetical protein